MSTPTILPRSIIVDLEEFVELLKHQLHAFYPVEIDEEELYEFIVALLEFHIDKHLLWCGSGDQRLARFVKKIYPWLQFGEDEHYANTFDDLVLDVVGDRILQYLHYFIRTATWDVVTIKRRGKSGIITRGDDFRVLDWHRMQEQHALEKTHEDHLS